MVKIVASILSAELTRLGEQVREAEDAGVDAIQIDVMDGRFVPNITFGPNVVSAIRPLLDLELEADLMIVEPENFLEEFVDAGVDRIIVHYESCLHLHRILESIHELNVEAGISINPGTSLTVLEEVLEMVELIQIMTVNPGFGGQPFLHSQLDKIFRLKQALEAAELDIPIGVDGGVSTSTAPLVVEAGAKSLVSGSGIYNSEASVAENVEALRKSIK